MWAYISCLKSLNFHADEYHCGDSVSLQLVIFEGLVTILGGGNIRFQVGRSVFVKKWAPMSSFVFDKFTFDIMNINLF